MNSDVDFRLATVSYMQRFIDRLKKQRRSKIAAFFASWPELLAAVSAGIVAYRLLAFVTGETWLTVLRMAAFVVVTLFWAIRFYERHEEFRTET